MSHSAYNRQWKEAQTALDDLLKQELPPEPPKPEKDRQAAAQLLATMYIKYIQIYRSLEQCYDQIVHPQKRRLLRHVLDATMGRVLELKNEMVNLEYSEFHYFDDVLSDLKLTPNDIELPIPKYFINERVKVLKEREKLLGQILSRIGPSDKIEVRFRPPKEEIRLTLEDAIRVIQVHERARQGRLRAKFMREIRMQEEREKMAATRGAPTMDPDVAAVHIQRMWKGYSTRVLARKQREEEMIFIGMTPPPTTTTTTTTTTGSGGEKQSPRAVKLKVEATRRVTQEQHEMEYQQALVSIKDKLRETEGPDMKETMQDQIRQWFIECRDATGKFPDYPNEEEGGSAAIFKEKDPAELEAELKAKEEEEGGKGGVGGGRGEEKQKASGKKGKKKEKGKKGKRESEEEDEGWRISQSQFLPTMGEAQRVFRSTWEARDESANFSQKHDVELIKEDKRKEVEAEIRVQVDEIMRQELKNLKLAIDRDKGKKGKKGKKSGKKKKKKGKKSGKGKKKKKEKDLTPDRSIESLYEELVMEGIMVRCPKVVLPEYEGDYSYLGTVLRNSNAEPMPSISDIRRVVTEYCILPLGSQSVHEKAPFIKSVLFSGPRGTGKKMLVHSVCTETGANLIDLTATNIAGKYPGKEGLKMMMHMVMKVARALQPTVVYIGDAERTFLKKVPKNDKSDPKRLKKDLPKLLKSMKLEDRVLLVGTSRQPFDCEMKGLASTFQKIILLPRPDYASRNILWRCLVTKFGGHISPNLDISSLSKITDGYTPGHMVSAIQQVLTERRISQLSKKPIQAVEFVAPLARIDPIYKEEEEAFKNWFSKTPLGKKRAEASAGDDDDAGKGEKGKKGGEKGKKKKK